MYSDRNLVNRRNIKSDVSAAANACRRFFQLEVEARIIAAALSILGMKKMDDEKPIRDMFEGTSTTDNKKSYLHHISSLVVDKFVVDQKRNTDVEQSYGLCRRTKISNQMYMDGFPADFQDVAKHSPIMENCEKTMKPSIIHLHLYLVVMLISLSLQASKMMTCFPTKEHYWTMVCLSLTSLMQFPKVMENGSFGAGSFSSCISNTSEPTNIR